MSIQILPATLEDLPSILALQKECYLSEAELYNAYDIPPLTQTEEEIIQEFNAGTVFLKGVVGGNIIASVRGALKADTACIGRLMVQREFQNKGYGQLLMQSIESALNHAARFELFTGDKSVKNLLLYQKIGYAECKRQTFDSGLTLVYLDKMN